MGSELHFDSFMYGIVIGVFVVVPLFMAVFCAAMDWRYAAGEW